MKKLLNFRNIAIAALIIYILLQWFNPGGVMPGGRTIRIDGKKYEVLKHTIDTIEVEMPTDIDATIDVADGISMIMKYPSASITDKLQQFENEIDLMTFFIVNCIDTILTPEEIFPASDYSSAELEEFIDQLPVTSFEKIREFFEKMPKLYHKIEYTNEEGNDRSIELNNLKDFFMWR